MVDHPKTASLRSSQTYTDMDDVESGSRTYHPGSSFFSIHTDAACSALDGRSYRFGGVLNGTRPRHEEANLSTYSATKDHIRHETAELADIGVNDENLSGYSGATLSRAGHAAVPKTGLAEPRFHSDMGELNECTCLFRGCSTSYSAIPDTRNLSYGTEAMETWDTQGSSLPSDRHPRFSSLSQDNHAYRLTHVCHSTWRDVGHVLMEPVRTLPAVILGLFLNILDGVSYGMITFPTSLPIFSTFGGDGVSMFFVTCVVSQLVYTLGGSIFKGGNGSMMIEVVPFYHLIVKDILRVVGEDNPSSLIATTMVAFALSSVLTGLLFWLQGVFHLGVLISYFPRHILVGCIGGVGVFLVETGIAVTAGLESESGVQYNWATVLQLVSSTETVFQWLLPLVQAVLLNVISSRCHSPLLIPMYFLVVLALFYVISLGILGLDMPTLWDRGWVFDVREAANAPFYRYLTYFDITQINWTALWSTLQTQMALVFFGILHVPLNVPALGVTIGEDNVDLDKELRAHGVSNVAAGLLGTVPNYLCYVNSVMFYRVGGGSRLSGIMLAAGTTMVLLIGPSPIGYLPIMVVGALIFVLGIDLVREALWDTWGRVNRLEYITILIIVVAMTLTDFVIGCLVGLALACIFFVMQTSRRNAVRSALSGAAARSTVRRHLTQRRFLDDVAKQTKILKLQGSLFFGTINSVESLVRKMLDLDEWHKNPISFLVMDFGLVQSVDFSAMEAMLRIRRMLRTRDVHLVFCGLSLDGDVAHSLQKADLWTDRANGLDVFATLNEALEWTENEYIRGLYMFNLSMTAGAPRPSSIAGQSTFRSIHPKPKPTVTYDEVDENPPRYEQLREAARRVTQNLQKGSDFMPGIPYENGASQQDTSAASISLLSITLGPYMDHSQKSEHLFQLISKELKEMVIPKDTLLWDWNEQPDALYFIESGILKARYAFPQDDYEISEAMLAGTIAGELTFLAQQPRDTMVRTEVDTKVWRLNGQSVNNIVHQDTQAYTMLVQLLLRITADEQNCLRSYLVSQMS